ncbi:MAG: ribokinase [Caldilineaceae bacterium]
MKPKLCVVGASNVDLVSFAPRLPKLGETVHGSSFLMGFGGKGANQAVMAAKLGAEVTMITRLGDDIFGRDYLENYKGLGFDTRYVLMTADTATGVAPIWVDEPSGNNAIIVVPGANGLLSPADIDAARTAITTADVLICQWECALETSLAALRIAHEAGVQTIFNPAPAQPDLPAGAYALCDIFCPNESETELLTGKPVKTVEEAAAAGQTLLTRGARNVILTLGERGSLLVNHAGVHHVPTTKVKAIDTTGAGDSFVGSLAYFLAAGIALPEAIARANQVAAISVQKPGTQASFPTRAELPAALFVP